VNLLNALVIYFAVGAPFGVLSMSRGRVFSVSTGRAFVDVVFWPFAAISTFAHRVVNLWPHNFEVPASESTLNNPPAVSSNSRAELMAARRKSEILVGIELALDNARRTENIEAPFLEAVTHPRADIAARCFHRRNIARLEKHLDRLNS
jgi:hypothetical protein